MALTSIGDLARHFVSLQQNGALKERLQRLSTELATGQVSDPVAHLSGRSDRIGDLDRRITLQTAAVSASRALGQRLETAQVVLDSVETMRGDLSANLLAVPQQGLPVAIATASARAGQVFEATVSAMNSRHGAESLFAGTATDGPALAAAPDILAAVQTAVAGAVDAADLQARLDTFFDSPSGGFATMAYQGDSGPPAVRRIEGGRSIELAPRADDPAIRTVLKAAALASVAADPGLALSDAERAKAQRAAGMTLMAAADPLTAARGRLGVAQEDVDATVARQAASLSATTILRNDLTSADPFETASALQQVEARLATQYAVTARLAGLSLAGYLR